MSVLPELSLQVSTIASQLQNLRDLLQGVLNELPRLRADIVLVNAAILAHKEEVKAALVEVSKLKSLVSVVREEFARNLCTASSSLIKLIEEKVKILPDLMQKHHSHQSILDKFERTIESVALDSKNAMLKTNNVEVVTMLNRKKLDNIQLILKQRELQKGE